MMRCPCQRNDQGAGPETLEHFLFDCPLWAEQLGGIRQGIPDCSTVTALGLIEDLPVTPDKPTALKDAKRFARKCINEFVSAWRRRARLLNPPQNDVADQ
jgi:hypothetical protein